MKKVFLTSGPRGSGKSTYTKKIAKLHPEFNLISRDEISISLFKSIYLSPYTGDHHYLKEVVFERIGKLLSENQDVTIILDYWNGFSHEREALIRKLRDLGADEVYCLYFEVSLTTCIRWFKEKKDSGSLSESSIKNDYELYYSKAKDIRRDGFDKVFLINPSQEEFEFVLDTPFLPVRKKSAVKLFFRGPHAK